MKSINAVLSCLLLLSQTTLANTSHAPVVTTIQVQGVVNIDPLETQGSKTAPIVMEVFEDYQCPACRQLYLTTHQSIVDNYVNSGKIYLIHRDYPIHEHARLAARYVRAAAQVGKLEVVQQVLFQNQEKWEATGDIDGTIAAVLPTAKMIKIRALVRSNALDSFTDRDYALGQVYHVYQTPTIIIHVGGQIYPIAGVTTFDMLREFIDQLLK
jgi:protein-disulfide isomerase